MKLPVFRTGYEPDSERDAHSDRCGFACEGDSLTVQADARDADINVIMERYTRTGTFPGLSRIPEYGDFDGISDFRQALEAVGEAQELFMELPAKLRSRFENDAVQFVEFVGNPANQDELGELGLLSREAFDALKKRRAAEAAEKADQAEPGRGAAAAARREPDRGRKSATKDAGSTGEDH